MRKEFKNTVMDLAGQDEDIVVILGDVSVYLFQDFKERYPDRFYNMGICENTLISVSAGIASQGLRPFVQHDRPVHHGAQLRADQARHVLQPVRREHRILLVDILLDSAAMGVNIVEREGISVSHPAKFILVGTMNPEEGEIRPQLLDRFGLSVDIKGTKDAKERIEIIRVVEEFEKDPESFSRKYEKGQENLRQRILKGRERLNDVDVPEGLLQTIARICLEFEVHGHRADFLIARTAKTLAAYKQRKTAREQDVEEAAALVLPHRMRRLPFEETKPVTEKVHKIIRQRKTPSSESENNSSEYEGGHEDKEADACLPEAMLQSGLNVRPVIKHRLPYTEYQRALDIMGRGQSGKVLMGWSQ